MLHKSWSCFSFQPALNLFWQKPSGMTLLHVPYGWLLPKIQFLTFSGVKKRRCLVLNITGKHIFQFIQWDFKAFHKTTSGGGFPEPQRVSMWFFHWSENMKNHRIWNLAFSQTYPSAKYIIHFNRTENSLCSSPPTHFVHTRPINTYVCDVQITCRDNQRHVLVFSIWIQCRGIKKNNTCRPGELVHLHCTLHPPKWQRIKLLLLLAQTKKKKLLTHSLFTGAEAEGALKLHQLHRWGVVAVFSGGQPAEIFHLRVWRQ